jgi:hypothetical protein
MQSKIREGAGADGLGRIWSDPRCDCGDRGLGHANSFLVMANATVRGAAHEAGFADR